VVGFKRRPSRSTRAFEPPNASIALGLNLLILTIDIGRTHVSVSNRFACSVLNAPSRSKCGDAEGLRLYRFKPTLKSRDEGGELVVVPAPICRCCDTKTA
jgi:hypothetical protein